MNLVIVESPAKAKTIEKYLGENYKVMASVGHIIDLPTKEIGVDIDNNFEPKYTIIEGKEKVINELKKNAKKASTIYLAPDPDREGEAIAWHIAEQIKGKNKTIRRVLFNEITKKGIQDGISNPGNINEHRVQAQQSRRILDRLVGYLVSPLLWKPLKVGLSAGRVQSVALRLVCEREREIEVFIPIESWSISGEFAILDQAGKESGILSAKLEKIDGKKSDLKNKEAVLKVLSDLPTDYKVISVEKKEMKQSPADSFITSKLQQEAIRKLGFSAKKVMMVAQQLYEGVEVGKLGAIGLITYMRTDSVRVSPEAVEECSKYIKDIYGNEYLSNSNRIAKKGKNSIQDAHEAIRPTSVMRTPSDIKEFLTVDQYKLYKLIWERFVASRMSDAVYNQTVILIKSGKYQFKAVARVLKFAGFTKLYLESKEEDNVEDEDSPILFDIEEGNDAKLIKPQEKQHFTQSPPRYTEASLVKTLEQQGIGRPSTYASILSTIIDRKYADLKEKKFYPTELGRIVNNLLIKNFPKIFEVKFTAIMEKELDSIEEGKENWKNVLNTFYTDFNKELKTACEGKIAADLTTNIKCPNCNEGQLIIKYGKNGAFTACERYPECNFTSDFKREENGEITLIKDKERSGIGVNCEKCGKELVLKKSRFGEIIACPGYPDCKNIKNFLRRSDGSIRLINSGENLNQKCFKCNDGDIIIKSGKNGLFAACSMYPDCRFTGSIVMDNNDQLTVSKDKVSESEENCEKCGKPMVIKRGRRGSFLACSGYPDCKNIKNLK